MAANEEYYTADFQVVAARRSRAEVARNAAIAVAVLLLVAASYAAHVRVSPVASDYTGSLAALDRVFDLLTASVLAVLCFSAGRRVCRMLSVSFRGEAEEISFSIMTGLGVIGLSVLLFGLAGLLEGRWIGGLLIALAVFSWPEFRTLSSTLNSARLKAFSSWRSSIIAVLFIAVVLMLLSRALVPPHSVAESTYQLAVPKLFIQHGHVYPVVDNYLGNSPFLMEMIYTLCLMAKADISARVFALIIALATAAAIYAFCVRYANRKLAVLSVFAFFGAGIVFETSSRASSELALTGTLFLAYFAMAAYFDSGKKPWLALSAILTGLSLGLAYSAIAGLPFLCGFFCWKTFSRKAPLADTLRKAALFAGICLAIASPWYLKNAVWFHNPVYPYVTGQVADIGNGTVRYYNESDEKKVDGFFREAGDEIPETVGKVKTGLAIATAHRIDREPLKIWQYFTRPDDYEAEGEQYADPNYLFLLIPLLLFLARPKWVVWLVASAVSYFLIVTYFSWASRLLLPIFPALTIAAVYTISEISERLRKHTWFGPALPVLLVGIVMASSLWVSAVQVYRYRSLDFIAGKISRENFLGSEWYHYPINFINRQLPRDGGVLMVGMGTTYDLQRDYIADTSWSSNEWKRLLVSDGSMESIRQNLKRRGVKYLLFTPNSFLLSTLSGWDRSGQPHDIQLVRNVPLLDGFLFNEPGKERVGPDRYKDAQRVNWATVELFCHKFGSLVHYWEIGDVQLYRIN